MEIVRALSLRRAHSSPMPDFRLTPQRMLHVGELFALNGDRGNATRAYREVMLIGDQRTRGIAAQRLRSLGERVSL